MKNDKFAVLYLKRAKWTFLTNKDNKPELFTSIANAKLKVDNLRKEKSHPICIPKSCVIYKYANSTIHGYGTKY